MTKLDISNWSQLDFLINNFFEIVEYKRGRGVYGDRVVLKRYKNPNAIFKEPERLCDFYYLDAHPVKELPLTQRLKANNIIKMVTSPADMNIICGGIADVDPTIWAVETRNMLQNEINSGIDYKIMNQTLLSQFEKLSIEFKENLQEHRKKQYTIALGLELVPNDYVLEQLNITI